MTPDRREEAGRGMQIEILLVDGHAIVRRGVRALLEANPRFSIVGEAGDGCQAVELAERLRPDLMIVDLNIPGLDGLETIRRVKRDVPRTRILVFSMHASEASVTEALRCGASGYALKDNDVSNIIQAVHDVCAGRRYLSPALSDIVIVACIRRGGESSADRYDMLTPRERRVLHFAAGGWTNAEIASALAISARTVETHRAHLMRKLGLKTRWDLFAYSMRRGLLSFSDTPDFALSQPPP
jgi:two-component system, NarL family, response regulator NreC